MTLSASLINQHKWSFYWLGFSVFLLIFAIIYEHFSHGVYSLWMMTMPLIPFLFGSVLCFFVYPDRIYQDGVLALTFSFLLKGVLEIYGTKNTFTDYLLYVSVILLVTGGIMTWRRNKK